MTTAVYALAASSIAQERGLEVLANNLANANSPGFKADKPIFRAYMERVQAPSAATAAAGQAAIGPQAITVLLDGLQVDFAQGPIQRTGNDLDLAIDGDGFFVVQTPQGMRYARAGNFTMGSDGSLLTASNFPVMGARGPVVLRGGKFEVGSDGRIRVDGAEADRLMIVDFPKPYRLIKDETGLLMPSGGAAASEPVRFEAAIKQGYLELSNVNPVRELVRLIAAARAIESYQKSIQRLLGDQGILSRSATDIGRLA